MAAETRFNVDALFQNVLLSSQEGIPVLADNLDLFLAPCDEQNRTLISLQLVKMACTVNNRSLYCMYADSLHGTINAKHREQRFHSLDPDDLVLGQWAHLNIGAAAGRGDASGVGCWWMT